MDAPWLEIQLERIPRRYRDVEPDDRKWHVAGLFLHGNPGCGKTHTAAAVMRHHIDGGERTRWCSVPTWLEASRGSYSGGERPESVSFLTDCDLLVLDDVGTKRSEKDGSRELLYVLINAAYDNETPLIVTSNVDYSELAARIGARLVSRIAEMCTPVDMSGPDRRLAS